MTNFETLILNSGQILGFTPYCEAMVGSIYWENKENGVMFFATPNWETEGVINLDFYADEPHNDIVEKHTMTGVTVEEQLLEYRGVVGKFIQNYLM